MFFPKVNIAVDTKTNKQKKLKQTPYNYIYGITISKDISDIGQKIKDYIDIINEIP